MVISLPLIFDKNEIELFADNDDNIIINGEYKEININGDPIKKLIPDGKFEYKIPLPSK